MKKSPAMGDIMQQQLIQDLNAICNRWKMKRRDYALNAFRQVLHQYSPFKSQPVDCVLWVKQERFAQ
jgi:hypothetical protein